MYDVPEDIVDRIDYWDRCYPGNLNIEMVVNDARAEIVELRTRLSIIQEQRRLQKEQQDADLATAMKTCGAV